MPRETRSDRWCWCDGPLPHWGHTRSGRSRLGPFRAYDAPFPDARYLAGARAFPRLVPISPKDVAVAANLGAWQVLERCQKPFLTLFSNGDPISRGLDRALQRRMEDSGPEIAAKLIEWMRPSVTTANARA